MTILKLPNAGDRHTGHVTACTGEQGQFGPQVKFTFANGDLLYLPASSAHSQLLHAGFVEAPDSNDPDTPFADLSTVPGHSLMFSRVASKKPGQKPYWNIDLALHPEAAPIKRLAGPSDPRAAQWTAPDIPTAPESRTRAFLAAAYVWEYRTAFEAQRAVYDALVADGGGYGAMTPTAASVQAGAATLGIQAEKHGITFTPLISGALAAVMGLVPVSEDDDSMPF